MERVPKRWEDLPLAWWKFISKAGAGGYFPCSRKFTDLSRVGYRIRGQDHPGSFDGLLRCNLNNIYETATVMSRSASCQMPRILSG